MFIHFFDQILELFRQYGIFGLNVFGIIAYFYIDYISSKRYSENEFIINEIPALY
jgi:hypothetical protein